MVSSKIHIKVNKTELENIIKQAGNVISDSSVYMAEEMKKSISSGAKSGKRYGNHNASAPGQAPANWTGKLLKSIKVQKTKGVAFVYITAKYAEFLEFGTSKMRPRPFIIPAFIKTKKMILDRLKRIAK